MQGGRRSEPLTREERTTLKLSFESYYFECAQGVWDRTTEEKVEDFVDRHRGDSCFFWPVESGMSIDAAKTLQKRGAANRELKRSNLYTKIALAIATLGLVASVVSNCSVPEGLGAGVSVQASQGEA